MNHIDGTQNTERRDAAPNTASADVVIRCGVVEAYDVEATGAVEAAFLVEHDWRRRGLGMALMQAAIQWAQENERHTLCMMFSRYNWPMRKLRQQRAGALRPEPR